MNKNEIVKLRVMQVDDKDVPAKYIEAFNSYLDKVVIPHFEKQIAEKDEEIERLKSCVMSKEQVEVIATQTIKDATPIIYKECCSQICKKIKQSAIFSGLIRDDDEIGVYTIEKDVLDQIEKGEQI